MATAANAAGRATAAPGAAFGGENRADRRSAFSPSALAAAVADFVVTPPQAFNTGDLAPRRQRSNAGGTVSSPLGGIAGVGGSTSSNLAGLSILASAGSPRAYLPLMTPTAAQRSTSTGTAGGGDYRLLDDHNRVVLTIPRASLEEPGGGVGMGASASSASALRLRDSSLELESASDAGGDEIDGADGDIQVAGGGGIFRMGMGFGSSRSTSAATGGGSRLRWGRAARPFGTLPEAALGASSTGGTAARTTGGARAGVVPGLRDASSSTGSPPDDTATATPSTSVTEAVRDQGERLQQQLQQESQPDATASHRRGGRVRWAFGGSKEPDGCASVPAPGHRRSAVSRVEAAAARKRKEAVIRQLNQPTIWVPPTQSKLQHHGIRRSCSFTGISQFEAAVVTQREMGIKATKLALAAAKEVRFDSSFRTTTAVQVGGAFQLFQQVTCLAKP